MKLLLSILITFLFYYFGKQYSDTFFVGWMCAILVDFVLALVKVLTED